MEKKLLKHTKDWIGIRNRDSVGHLKERGEEGGGDNNFLLKFLFFNCVLLNQLWQCRGLNLFRKCVAFLMKEKLKIICFDC